MVRIHQLPPKRDTFKKYLVSFLYKHYNKLRWWIRTARVRRFASRRAKTPLWGVFRARLGGFTSSHQNEILSRSISFLFYINIVTSCAGGFEQPASDTLRPVGQNTPCGVFLGRGLAGSTVPIKTRYFSGCISFF